MHTYMYTHLVRQGRLWWRPRLLYIICIRHIDLRININECIFIYTSILYAYIYVYAPGATDAENGGAPDS